MTVIGIHWTRQNIQTIFPAPNVQYFPVTTPAEVETNSNDNADDMITNMLQVAKLKDEEDYKQRNAVVSSKASRVERTPWLNRTDWLNIFDERDMKLLVECTSDKIKDGECLEEIKSSVKRVIKYCIDGVKDLNTIFTYDEDEVRDRFKV